MQGPKINPPPDNLLLSTLKRKGGYSKVLTHRSKKRIDTKVFNVSDMVGVLASAFQLLTLDFFLFISLSTINHPILQSSRLIGQSEQTNSTDSDRGPILEPVQEALADDTLVESSEQAEPDKTVEDIIDVVLIEQPNLQPTEVQSLLAILPTFSFSDFLFLLQDIAHDRSLSDLPQDVGDQSQLPIVEDPESSSAENPYAHIRATPFAVEVNSLTHFSFSFHTSSAYFNKLAFLFKVHRQSLF
jgi:hypothetical protein